MNIVTSTVHQAKVLKLYPIFDKHIQQCTEVGVEELMSRLQVHYIITYSFYHNCIVTIYKT